jgi:hypothetical protein
MDDALDRAQLWWEAREVRPVLPSMASTHLTLKWLQAHWLGRKRLLDTQLAATYAAAGVTSLLTSNSADFAVFEGFSFIDLER